MANTCHTHTLTQNTTNVTSGRNFNQFRGALRKCPAAHMGEIAHDLQQHNNNIRVHTHTHRRTCPKWCVQPASAQPLRKYVMLLKFERLLDWRTGAANIEFNSSRVQIWHTNTRYTYTHTATGGSHGDGAFSACSHTVCIFDPNIQPTTLCATT